MTVPITPSHQPLAWYPAPAPCPRCNQPLKAHGSPSWTKMLALLCTKCGWKMDLETVRIAIRKSLIPEEPENKDTDNDD